MGNSVVTTWHTCLNRDNLVHMLESKAGHIKFDHLNVPGPMLKTDPSVSSLEGTAGADAAMACGERTQGEVYILPGIRGLMEAEQDRNKAGRM